MDLILRRFAYREDGIFGEILDDKGEHLFYTLEHAYYDKNKNYSPIIPDGSYQCVRGEHRLAFAKDNFETFEITGVDGHSGLLFHVGNFNQDSNGCVLLGMELNRGSAYYSIKDSKIAFDKFIDMQIGYDQFTIVIG
jgi:hypothetical protein